MKRFLEHVASDIISKHGTDLSRLVVVVPNKRASLFLNDSLARCAGRPLWSPSYYTISELFRSHARLQVGDPLKLVCDLHRVYTAVTGFDETLDRFYGWGQLLLTDFDDIDKSMVDANQLFMNLSNIHELDDVSYLTEEQLETIKKFFQNFSSDHQSQLKERFLRLWSKMGDIYHQYNELLARQGLAYEGAAYRQVVADESQHFDHDRYLFVGFNLLQPVEQRLFDILKRQGKARFYWDFDHYYQDTEAGHFIGQSLGRYPNELPTESPDIYDNYRKPKHIAFVAASTENIQARYVSTWLRDASPADSDGSQRWEAGNRTAIVLCNEALLQPVIHCLPEEAAQVNITTGFPLQQSPVASLVELLVTLQTTGVQRQSDRFRLRAVTAVLAHPYASYISGQSAALLSRLTSEHVYYPDRQLLSADDGLTLLFGTPADDNASLLHWLAALIERIAVNSHEGGREGGGTDKESPLMDESLFRMFTLLNRLATLVESADLKVDVTTLQRLIGQLVQQTTIPFHGEPAVGIQVMGMLETRNLDFDHLLMLSTNEGNIPRGVSDASFIPYSLRKAFGMTTADHKVAIYAYHFNRLISRATDVTLVYNNATTDGHTGEISRFMLQMLVECPHTIRQFSLKTDQHITPRQHTAIKKTDHVVAVLKRRFDKALAPAPSTGNESPLPQLTPTAINRYMRCQLQFYYHYVEGLREPDENDDDTIDNRIFGNIFHTAAQLLYEKLMEKSRRIETADIDEVLKSKIDIERAVDTAFRLELFKLKDEQTPFHPQLNGLQIISRQVVIHYLQQLLRLDRRLAPFEVLELEADVVEDLPIGSLGITTTVGGRIDRLDCIRGDGPTGQLIRVIDYKTGARRLKSLKGVDDIFDPSQLHNHNDYYLQTLLYSRIVRRGSTHPVAPALLFIQHAQGDDYDPVLKFGTDRIADVATPDGERFEELLTEKVNEIFDPHSEFVPTTNPDVCRTCPYALLC